MDNTQQYFGLKELNSVVIRAYKDTTIGTRFYRAGEPILYFEKLQVGELQENTKLIMARGGHGNYPHVVWENFGDFRFKMVEGVLSKASFSILSNAGAFEREPGEMTKKVPKREILTVYGGKVTTLQKPLTEKLFIYSLNEDGMTEEEIRSYTIDGRNVIVGEQYNNKQIVLDYYFEYTNAYTNYMIGSEKIDEILCLEGKAYFKDEVTGLNKTFLFEIPKMKITSNLNIVMGEKASPTISVFNVIGLPIKENNQWIVSKMYLLSDDIDNDI